MNIEKIEEMLVTLREALAEAEANGHWFTVHYTLSAIHSLERTLRNQQKTMLPKLEIVRC